MNALIRLYLQHYPLPNFVSSVDFPYLPIKINISNPNKGFIFNSVYISKTLELLFSKTTVSLSHLKKYLVITYLVHIQFSLSLNVT